jgi:processive 1,2-diacylglycerol beta-glucosyltransferase
MNLWTDALARSRQACSRVGQLRILILSASIGEGHDLPARVLAEGLAEEAPGAEIEIFDTLALIGPVPRRIVMGGSRFHSQLGSRLFDLSHRLISDIGPTRRLAGKAIELFGRRPIRRAVVEIAPDVVISTYPAATETLGRLRLRAEVNVPVVSAITDLAALRYWAHPGIDLHLITHPQSATEVAEIAPGSQIACVRGLTDARFYEPRDQVEARHSLGMPDEGPIVLVSGGGWAVGDLAGAAQEALALPGSTVVCLCGRNDELRIKLAQRFSSEPRIFVEGFTDRMPEWFAAADLLVHSTAGLTVLEAIMRGCGVVSYGWGFGHVRVNNEAFARFGLAEVARSREALPDALVRALAIRQGPNDSFARLPHAASAILALADGQPGYGGRARQEAGTNADHH